MGGGERLTESPQRVEGFAQAIRFVFESLAFLDQFFNPLQQLLGIGSIERPLFGIEEELRQRPASQVLV